MVIQPGGASVGAALGDALSTAEIAIPPLSNGSNPKWVHVSTPGPASAGGGVWIFFGITGMGAATKVNGIGVCSWGPGIIINVAGHTHYRIIADAANTDYSLTPLAGIVAGG